MKIQTTSIGTFEVFHTAWTFEQGWHVLLIPNLSRAATPWHTIYYLAQYICPRDMKANSSLIFPGLQTAPGLLEWNEVRDLWT